MSCSPGAAPQSDQDARRKRQREQDAATAALRLSRGRGCAGRGPSSRGRVQYRRGDRRREAGAAARHRPDHLRRVVARAGQYDEPAGLAFSARFHSGRSLQLAGKRRQSRALRCIAHAAPWPQIVTAADGPALFHADFSPVTTAKPARAGETLIMTATAVSQLSDGSDGQW